MVRIANTASNIRNPIFHKVSSACGLSSSTSSVKDKVKKLIKAYIQRIIKILSKEKPKSTLALYLYDQEDMIH